MQNPLNSPQILTLQRSAALVFAASMVWAPAAHAETRADEEQGGTYLSLSGGLAHPLGKADIAGRLSAGTPAIPFVGTSGYKAGWDGRVAIGYEERLDAANFAEDGRQAPRYRVELEAMMLRLKRTSYNAGLLQVKPEDQLKAQAIFANAYVRLLGKGTARLWAGAGIGYGRATLPDARQIAACACLGPAKGRGLTYQGKVSAEIRLSPRLQLITEAAFVNLPGLSTAERPVPVATYAKSQAVTTNAGFRLSF